MATPSHSVNWEFALNLAVDGSTALVAGKGHSGYRNFWRAVKDAITDSGTFSSPWTVESSSNGTVADSSDNWNSLSDVYWRTGTPGPTCWIVLHNSAAGIYMCLALIYTVGANGSAMDIYLSDEPFTGGSTTAVPTASSMQQICGENTVSETGIANYPYWGPTEVGTMHTHTYRAHVMMSEDGLHTYLVFCYSGKPRCMIALSALENTSATRRGEFVVLFALHGSTSISTGSQIATGSNTHVATYDSYANRISSGVILNEDATIITSAYGTASGNLSLNSSGITTTHPVSSNPVAFPVWIGSYFETTRGVRGNFPDLYLTLSSLSTAYDTAPPAQPDWMSLSGLIVPWDGTTVVQTT